LTHHEDDDDDGICHSLICMNPREGSMESHGLQ